MTSKKCIYYSTFAMMFLFFFVAPGISNPVALSKPLSIVDEIKHDLNLCKDMKTFADSKYMKECKLPVLDLDAKLSVPLFPAFLCYSIYDAMCRICQLSSINGQFNGKSLLHEEVEKNVVENEDLVAKQNGTAFCKGMRLSDSTTKCNKTENFVNQLAKELQDNLFCTMSCKLDTPGAKPMQLCVVLHWMYKVIHESYNNSTNVGIAYAPTIDTSLKKHVEKTIEDKPKIAQETKPVSKENNKSETPEVEKDTAKVIDNKEKKPQDSQPENPKAKDSEPEKQKTQEAEKPKIQEAEKKDENVEKKTVENIVEDENVVETPEKNEEIVDTPDNTGLEDDDIMPKKQKEESSFSQNNPIDMYQDVEEESHLFSYFIFFTLCTFVLYIIYLSKQKILATFAKMRRSRSRNRRRPSIANYRKLDCTLEEAVNSQCSNNVTQVIY